MTVRCPDCGEEIELPPGVTSGDLLECPNCAGHALRIREVGGQSATLAYRVSCPDCETMMTLPEDVKAGKPQQTLDAALREGKGMGQSTRGGRM